MKLKNGAVVLMTIVLIFAGSARGVVINVSSGTIQDAIDSSSNGDVIVVSPGTYLERINFNGKAITVRSTAPTSSGIVNTTIIDGQASGSVVSFVSGEGANSILQGFTIRNGLAASGGGIICQNSSPTIQNNVITRNKSTASPVSGGGIYCIGSSAKILNNVITGNYSGWGEGGGVYLKNSPVDFRNNTLHGNQSKSASAAVAVENASSITTTIKNCIIRGNTSANYHEIWLIGGGGLAVSYSNVKGGQALVYVEPGSTLTWGAGNSDTDPLFINQGTWDDGLAIWTNGDYHLKSQAGRWNPVSSGWVLDAVTSPCIDTGDPASVFSSEPAVNGGRINMGAYGNTSEASKSYFVIKISGYVRTSSSTAISGVQMSANNGGKSGVTNSGGYYEIRVPANWSGTVTPSKSGYIFNPVNRPYTSLAADQANQNFTGTVNPPKKISGYIKSGSGISGVTVTASSGGTTKTTDANGYYEVVVPANWSGTVTPSKSGWTFDPVKRTYTNVAADQSNQNYTGSLSVKGVAIIGVSSVYEKSTGQYTCRATFVDNSTVDVTNLATWSVTGAYAATIDTHGKLTTGSVISNQTCKIKATYKGASAEKTVTIRNTGSVFPTGGPIPTPTPTPTPGAPSNPTPTPKPSVKPVAPTGGCGSAGLMLIALSLFGFLAIVGYRTK